MKWNEGGQGLVSVRATVHDETNIHEYMKKMAILIDVAIVSDSNIRKKEHEKIKKYQGQRGAREEVEIEGNNGPCGNKAPRASAC